MATVSVAVFVLALAAADRIRADTKLQSQASTIHTCASVRPAQFPILPARPGASYQ